MAITNRERVGKALDCLSAGLAPFVERELKVVHGDRWQEIALDSGPKSSSGKKQPKANLNDPQLLLGRCGTSGTMSSRTLGPGRA